MELKLWITYAWTDNTEGDFDYLVGQLEAAGIGAQYDRVALIPGRRLWDQIAKRITNEPLSGWAYLVTPKSLQSNACQEELWYALQRTLDTKGDEFPLLGLLSGVRIADVPTALKVRLCVDLRSPDWIEQVRAGLENRPSLRKVEETPNWKAFTHSGYLGNANLRAVEFCPRFGELRYWRIAFPSDGPQPVMRGVGPANGGGITGALQCFLEGAVELDGRQMKFFGAGDALTPATSAYIVFERNLPATISFGWANAPYDMPVQFANLRLS